MSALRDLVAAAVSDAGLTDVVVVEDSSTETEFDDATDTWRLRTATGEASAARVVIDVAGGRHQPRVPEHLGHNDFHGPSFHCADWPTGFQPAGKHVAVIGDRGAHVLPALAGAGVKIFDSPPHLVVRPPRRSMWKALRKNTIALIRADVDRITSSGVLTADGTEHAVDVIVFATGAVAVPDHAARVATVRATLAQAWRDRAESYAGIAVHGFPNFFMLLGPDSPAGSEREVVDAQLREIVACLTLMRRHDSTRIEVRRSAQRQFSERARVGPPARAFDLSCVAGVEDEIYDGPATLVVGGGDHAVRARLTGHLDPIDGKYHWRGMLFDAPPGLPLGSSDVRLAIDGQRAPARLTEQTPWAGYSIAGVGAPPFSLDPVDLVVATL